MDRQVQSV